MNTTKTCNVCYLSINSSEPYVNTCECICVGPGCGNTVCSCGSCKCGKTICDCNEHDCECKQCDICGTYARGLRACPHCNSRPCDCICGVCQKDWCDCECDEGIRTHEHKECHQKDNECDMIDHNECFRCHKMDTPVCIWCRYCCECTK